MVIFTVESISEINMKNKKENQFLKIKIITKNHVSCSEEPGSLTKV